MSTEIQPTQSTSVQREGRTRPNLRISLAQNENEVREAQRLRYKIFGEEMGARLSTRIPEHDTDLFDPYCDHLLVRDENTGKVVGTYRILSPEAAKRVFEREHSGLMELARLRCMSKTPRTFLSRGVAGTIGRTLILTLPGSVRGSSENLEALLDILPHAVETLRGEVQDDGRPDAAAVTGKVIRRER